MPIGEKLGLSAWQRWLGFQGHPTPERLWTRQQVCIVSDESDLVSPTYGPRGISGGQQPSVVAEWSAWVVQAGEAGCRVWFGYATTQIARFGYRSALPALTGGGTPVTVQWSDPAQQGRSRVLTGSLAADPAASGDAHWVLGPMHTPVFVAPGTFLLLYRTTAAAILDVSLVIEEHGSPAAT